MRMLRQPQEMDDDEKGYLILFTFAKIAGIGTCNYRSHRAFHSRYISKFKYQYPIYPILI